MEEVVYQFLIQTAGYPRASIVSDTSLVFDNTEGRPAYLIVDPESAEPLAVVHVVGAVDASGLYAAAHAAEANKKELKRSTVQGIVVRIDFKGRTDSEKIQFYQTKADAELYPLSASTFPDLDSLRVGNKLNGVIRNNPSALTAKTSLTAGATSNNAEFISVDEEDASEAQQKSRLGLWLGLLLLLITLADVVTVQLGQDGWIRTQHSVLLVGAALLFLLASRKRHLLGNARN